MSTKSTVFLTEDDEHCYTDCSMPVINSNKEYVGDELILEIDLKNIDIHKDSDTLTLYFKNPTSEIYKKIKSIEKREFLIKQK